jgi:hypothetical protein
MIFFDKVKKNEKTSASVLDYEFSFLEVFSHIFPLLFLIFYPLLVFLIEEGVLVKVGLYGALILFFGNNIVDSSRFL